MQKLSKRLMFLLAFIEMFQEPLARIDFMKLLFLYCRQWRPKYSFFPYLYGCFSHEVYKDTRRLIQEGLLSDDGKTLSAQPAGFRAFDRLDQEERTSLYWFRRQNGSLRGDALIRKTYLEYPEYMKLSVIKDRVLSAGEIRALSMPEELPLGKGPAIFTIGYQGIDIDEYLRRLLKADIDTLVDVRKNPRSMKFDFNAKKLAGYLGKVSIRYLGMPELGVPAGLRADLDSDAAYRELFRLYDSEILPLQTGPLEEIAALVNGGARVALTCFEKDYSHCHRHRIAEKLRRDKRFDVIHL